jgi:hypothetical protein
MASCRRCSELQAHVVATSGAREEAGPGVQTHAAAPRLLPTELGPESRERYGD